MGAVMGVEVRPSLRPRQGRRFEPTHELAVVASARRCAAGLPGAHRGLLLVGELAGPQGIPDLTAIVGPPEPLQRRLASGVPPLLNELDAGVAAAASATVPRSVEALAKELGWPPAVVAARMTGLLRAGAISEPSPGRYRRDPALGPIGRIYAIEAKVRDGGAALRQVRAYTTWADAYVIVTGAMGETARSRLEPEVHRDGGGLVVAGRWRQRPRLRPTSRARRLRSAEHIVAALDPAMVG